MNVLSKTYPAMASALLAAAMLVAASPAHAAQAYRFELAGPAQPAGAGRHAVFVKVVRAADSKPVAGASFTAIRLDMSPENMATMTAPVSEAPANIPGVYSFSFDDSTVWKWKGDWALSFVAKAPGAPQDVTGKIVFHAGM